MNETFIYRPLDELMLHDVIEKLYDENMGYVSNMVWTKQQMDTIDKVIRLECERLGYNF